MAAEIAARTVSPAAAGVVLNDEFVAAVHAALAPRLRLALSVLRDVTQCPDPVSAGLRLAAAVNAAIRATEPGRQIPPAMIDQIRGCVVEAILGVRPDLGWPRWPPAGPDRDSETLPRRADAGSG
jgi:hypothetical protein